MITEADLESVIRENKELLELGNSLEKLLRNSDFKSVVVEGYLKDYAVELVHKLADPTVDKTVIQSQLDSIAHFKSFLDRVTSNSEMAKKSIDESNEALLSIRNEV